MAVVGRRILGDVASMRATGSATITGAVEALCVFSLALGAEQIEQECRAVFALLGCEWTACTVPIVNTSTMQSTAVVLAMTLRLAQIRCNDIPYLLCCVSSILNLDDRFWTRERTGNDFCGNHRAWSKGDQPVRPVGRSNNNVDLSHFGTICYACDPGHGLMCHQSRLPIPSGSKLAMGEVRRRS